MGIHGLLLEILVIGKILIFHLMVNINQLVYLMVKYMFLLIMVLHGLLKTLIELGLVYQYRLMVNINQLVYRDWETYI